jgi:hypothetical protein
MSRAGRTQPGLPLGIGHIRTKTHDYVRHGTLTLFAALKLSRRQADQPLGGALAIRSGSLFSKQILITHDPQPI